MNLSTFDLQFPQVLESDFMAFASELLEWLVQRRNLKP
jgi:hypothetical protein